MIVEMRTYLLQPGTVPLYFKLYQAEGLETQTRILGRLLGYYATEVGPLNQVVHLWGYDSFEERMKRRSALFADAGWLAYIAKVTPYIISQESRIMNPAPFSPV